MQGCCRFLASDLMKSKITSRLPLRSDMSPARITALVSFLVNLTGVETPFVPVSNKSKCATYIRPDFTLPRRRERSHKRFFHLSQSKQDIPVGRPGNEVRRDGETRNLRMMCVFSFAVSSLLRLPPAFASACWCCHGRHGICGVTPSLQMAGRRACCRSDAGPF